MFCIQPFTVTSTEFIITFLSFSCPQNMHLRLKIDIALFFGMHIRLRCVNVFHTNIETSDC